MKKYLLLFVVILLFTSCAQDMGDIDRTQPDRIDKELFNSQDEWYMRNTVIDVPYSTGFAFIGQQGSTELVRWRITEDYLYAHRAHDWVDGSEEYLVQEDENGNKIYYGAPVAIYAIKSHFDVQRQYNPTSGEETNVIVENSSDKPWYERKFMRVDWSKNLVKDFRYGTISKIPSSSVAFYVSETDKASKEAPKVSKDYIDIVGMIFSEPETFTWGGHKYPYCYLYSQQHLDCLGQRIKYRTSFLKKDLENDYKAHSYNDVKFAKFGFFRTDRNKYDRWKGMSQREDLHLMNRWNIWKKGDADKAIAERETKKIVYYLNDDFPSDLVEEAEKVVCSWNRILKATVAKAKGMDVDFNTEFLKIDGAYFGDGSTSLGLTKEEICKPYLTDLPDVFILCPNNPVKSGDPAECGKEGTNPQIGDLRYSMIYWVANPQLSSPLGYGPAADDTETGEIFQANAFVYGNAVETYVSYVMDLVDLLNGDLDLFEYTSGLYLKKYIEDMNVSVEAKSLLINHDKTMSKDMLKNYDKISSYLRSGDFTKTISAADRLEGIRGTNIEKLLSTNALKSGMKAQFIDENGNLDNEAFENQSVLDIIDIKKLNAQEEFKKRLAQNTIMLSSFHDQTLISYAKKLKENFTGSDGTVDRVALEANIRKNIFFSTTLHEVGHTIGLRHNYHSSSDALNYFDQYWDLKLAQSGSNRLEPEYKRAPTQEMIEKGLRENQYTSIMDYLMRANSSLKGPGIYDYAAIHYGYGNQLMVFDGSGYDLDSYNNLKSDDYHYTQIPYLLKGSIPGSVGVEDLKTSMRSRKWAQLTTYEDVLCTQNDQCDSGICNKHGECVQCLVNTDCADTSKPFCSVDTGECIENLEVPIDFCSDEQVGTDWKCYRFVEGADFYERTKARIDLYNNYYFIRNFKSGRALFGMNLWGYIMGAYRRFNQFDTQFKYSVYESYIKRNDSTFISDSTKGEHFIMGNKNIMNLFANTMQTADPGIYDYSAAKNIYTQRETVYDFRPLEGGTDTLIYPGVSAKYESDLYDPNLGYYYYYKSAVQGVLYDKLYAMIAMSNPLFVPRGESYSGVLKEYAVNLYTIFPNEIQTVLAGIYSETPKAFGPYFVVNQDGTKTFKGRKAVFLTDQEKEDFENEVKEYVDPDIQYTTRLYSGWVIPAMFQTTWLTSSLYDSGRVGVIGSGDDYEPDFASLIKYDGTNEDVADYITVTDPNTHRTYFALKYNNFNDNSVKEFNLGWELVKHVREMYEEGGHQPWQYSGELEKMDVMRAFYHHYK